MNLTDTYPNCLAIAETNEQTNKHLHFCIQQMLLSNVTYNRENKPTNKYLRLHSCIFSLQLLSKGTCNRGNKQTNKQTKRHTFTSMNLADTYPK